MVLPFFRFLLLRSVTSCWERARLSLPAHFFFTVFPQRWNLTRQWKQMKWYHTCKSLSFIAVKHSSIKLHSVLIHLPNLINICSVWKQFSKCLIDHFARRNKKLCCLMTYYQKYNHTSSLWDKNREIEGRETRDVTWYFRKPNNLFFFFYKEIVCKGFNLYKPLISVDYFRLDWPNDICSNNSPFRFHKQEFKKLNSV